MPKPVYGDNRSGMHCQRVDLEGPPAGVRRQQISDLSETCLSCIAGVIRYAKAINAVTNPTTNSYKRLVPGFEVPVLLAYSAHDRSAASRIPWTTSPKASVEVRFPDPLGNPYLNFGAMLAGLDGAHSLRSGFLTRAKPRHRKYKARLTIIARHLVP
jgi:glutamine synthetase